MGMNRQPVVGMGFHVVELLPRLDGRIHMDCHSGDVGDTMQKIVADFLGDAVSLGDI